MSLITCKECGERISSEANFCPRCGFKNTTDDVVKFKVIDANGQVDNLMRISKTDNKKLMNLFCSNIDKLKQIVPEVAVYFEQAIQKDSKLVADIPDYIKNKIEDGSFSLMFDKSGDILPCLKDTKTNKIIKQFRLKEENLSPNLASTFLNIQIHATVQEILSEIKEINDGIKSVHVELQNDRYAKADSALLKIKQAEVIRDEELRKKFYIEAITTAVDAKCILMRNFEFSLSQLGRSKSSKKNEESAEDVINDLKYILYTQMVDVRGLSQMNEHDAVLSSLSDFDMFLEKNKLKDRNQLVLINEYSKDNKIKMLDKMQNDFVQISCRKKLLEDKTHKILMLDSDLYK